MSAKSLSDFNKKFIITRYSAIEGGYVFDPKDLGGETNHGVTKALAEYHKKDLVAKFGWDGTMKNLSKDMAYWIYDVAFWTKMRCDDLFAIHPLLADKVFDIGINGGRIRGIGFMQEFLNVMNNEQKLYKDLTVDGGNGNITMTALNGYVKARGAAGIKILLHGLIARQTAHYLEISIGREANERFAYGWYTRAFDSGVEYNKVMGLYS